MSEPITRHAIDLVVGDRISREFLPRMFGTGDPEVVFTKDTRFDGTSLVFVAVIYADGYGDSTSFRPGAELKVWPAPPAQAAGLNYGRGDEGAPTVATGRVPAPHEDGRTGEVVEVESSPAQPRCPGSPTGFQGECGRWGMHPAHLIAEC